jgi:hypothetical protein
MREERETSVLIGENPISDGRVNTLRPCMSIENRHVRRIRKKFCRDTVEH